MADEPHADRWIVLIALFMGLSIGVHLLNLLTIPAMTFVYYFRKYNPSTMGMIVAGIVSMVILVGVQYGIIPGVVAVASKFELVFVNSIGLPFNSGVLIYMLLLVAGIVLGLKITHQRGMTALKYCYPVFHHANDRVFNVYGNCYASLANPQWMRATRSMFSHFTVT